MKRFVLTLWLPLVLPLAAFAADRIGPNIEDDLKAAGLMGLPFSWRASDGALNLNDPALTAAQRTAIQNIFAAHVSKPTPDVTGFKNDLKVLIGPITEWNRLAKESPLFLRFLDANDWPIVQALIIDVKDRAVISTTLYNSIKAAAMNRNLPITLP